MCTLSHTVLSGVDNGERKGSLYTVGRTEALPHTITLTCQWNRERGFL